jgi:hypothetical protein
MRERAEEVKMTASPGSESAKRYSSTTSKVHTHLILI